MAEPFKNAFNPTMIALMADHLKTAFPAFDTRLFRGVAEMNLAKHELKQRSAQIVSALEATLPGEFGEACAVMLAALHPDEEGQGLDREMDHAGIRGWAMMPICEYVARHGMAEIDLSMGTLKEMTKRFTAEFAVRPFLQAAPETALAHISAWSADGNVHVRRLASEGTRPRLPWGIRLTEFDRDPTPILPILEALKDDPEEYVRRSVANNLNDIAKVHPDLVAKIAKRWLKGASSERKRLVRHACRTLIKAGHQPTLAALGYSEPELKGVILELSTKTVSIGESIEFGAVIISGSSASQPLIIDYIIHHQKANGTTSPKTFKWKTVELPGGETLEITRKHSFKTITTRVYHPGHHRLEIQINGKSYAEVDFLLKTSRSVGVPPVI